MEQTQVDIGPYSACLRIQSLYIAHRCRIRADADQRPLVAQVAPQQARKVSIGGNDFVKGKQMVPIAVLGERRAEEKHVTSKEWAQDFRVHYVATGARDALGLVRGDNVRGKVQAAIADAGKCLAIRRPLPRAIPATQFADGAHIGQQFTQQTYPLSDSLHVGAGKGRRGVGQLIRNIEYQTKSVDHQMKTIYFSCKVH